MNDIIKATFGTDPEFFLTKDGKPVSAIELIPGTKYDPHTLPSGGGLQTDNVALEFASVAHADVNDLVDHIRDTFKEIKEVMPEGHEIAVLPSIVFPEEELQHEQAKEFGCSPDFNVWKMEQNEAPVPEDLSLRSCGGHIHVGHEALETLEGKMLFVKLMDVFHGLTSTVLDCSESSIVRRKLYGKAGCHRPTSYGIEYRVLSNYWLKNPMLVRLQHSLVMDALKILNDTGHGLIDAIGEDTIVKTINEGNEDEAQSIINSYVLFHMSLASRKLFWECKRLEASTELSPEWRI